MCCGNGGSGWDVDGVVNRVFRFASGMKLQLDGNRGWRYCLADGATEVIAESVGVPEGVEPVKVSVDPATSHGSIGANLITRNQVSVLPLCSIGLRSMVGSRDPALGPAASHRALGIRTKASGPDPSSPPLPNYPKKLMT